MKSPSRFPFVLLLLAALAPSASSRAQIAPSSPGGELMPPRRPIAVLPLLRVEGAEQPVTLGSLDVRVVIHGLHAETTQTLTFHNPNGRVLEGELQFPLPDGATVNGYALDVGGQLVDGVVVTKEKARVVLETEIRRGVDPGLAEQVRGNLYRTRIYPIPARGSRTVRLSWVSELTTRGEEAAYHLPLPLDRPVGQVAMRIEVVRGPVAPEIIGGFGDLALKQWSDRWVAEGRFTGAAPARDLLVRLPRLPARLVTVEPGEGAEAFFSVTDLLPARAAGAAAAPRRIAIAWDASGSRDERTTDRELAFLARLLEAWKGAAVDLVLFRDRAEAPVAFAPGRDRERLLAALRDAPCDGGTGLASLSFERRALPSGDDALWILLSDGMGTLGEGLPLLGDVPVWTVTAATVADRALLRHLSRQTGGQLLDLVALAPEAAAAAIAAPGPRLVGVDGSAGAIADVQLAERADRSRVTVTGRLLAPEAELTLAFGDGAGDVERRVVRLRRADATDTGEGAGPVATAWAQGRAETLGIFPEVNAGSLLALGRRFGLVTAGTSLLVLETLEQHLEHDVQPAASRRELRAQYLAAVGKRDGAKKRTERDQLDRVAGLWAERVRWWQERHEVPSGWRWTDPAQMGDGPPRPGHDVLGDLGEHPEEDRLGASAQPSPPPAPALDGYGAGLGGPSRRAEREMPALGALGSASAPLAFDGGGSKAKAEGDAEVGDEVDAAVVIKPWDPQTPWLVALRAASPEAAYATYLGQRRSHAGPAFFLDCAGFFLQKGDKGLGLRILSNLAELRIDDPALLRVFAWRLQEAGELELAVATLEKVLRLRPEEGQSRRDLALALGELGEHRERPEQVARAIDLLYDVVRMPAQRTEEIELIALMELNRLAARAERRGWSDVAKAKQVDRRLRRLLDLDLRVSLSWDADLTDVDLHLYEPTQEHAFYGHQHTAIGGLVSRDVTNGYGPEEYVVRRAVPGPYAVKAHYFGSSQQTLVGPATVTATVFTNWGRPNETRQRLTLRLDDPRGEEPVGVIDVGAKGR